MTTNEQPEDVMAETLRGIAAELGERIMREVADAPRED